MLHFPASRKICAESCTGLFVTPKWFAVSIVIILAGSFIVLGVAQPLRRVNEIKHLVPDDRVTERSHGPRHEANSLSLKNKWPGAKPQHGHIDVLSDSVFFWNTTNRKSHHSIL